MAVVQNTPFQTMLFCIEDFTTIDILPEFIHELNYNDNYLGQKIAEMMEKKCNVHGLVLPESEIIQKSVGFFPNESFSGSIRYRIKYRISIFKPFVDSIVRVTIKEDNDFGLWGYYLLEDTEDVSDEIKNYFAHHNHPMTILIPKQLHCQDIENYNKCKKNESYLVRIKKAGCNQGDKNISCIGILYNS